MGSNSGTDIDPNTGVYQLRALLTTRVCGAAVDKIFNHFRGSFDNPVRDGRTFMQCTLWCISWCNCDNPVLEAVED